MSRLSYPQKRIRACDRILRKLYWELRHSIKEHSQDEREDKIQGDINYYEEVSERITISL